MDDERFRADCHTGGALRAQAIAKSTNEVGVDVNGPVIGNGSYYGGSGVHAPN